MRVLLVLLGFGALGVLYWLWSKGNVQPAGAYINVGVDPLTDAMIPRGFAGTPAPAVANGIWKGNVVTPSFRPLPPNIRSVETLSSTAVNPTISSVYQDSQVYG